MFKVKEYQDGMHNWFISDDNCNYIHRDGEIVYDACEYWPTEEQAQTVLDKYQPEHVWINGDVLRSKLGTIFVVVFMCNGNLRLVLTPGQNGTNGGLSGDLLNVNNILHEATFLFNIKDKLGDTDA